MHKYLLIAFIASLAFSLSWLTVQGEAPLPIKTVAPASDLTAAVADQLELLDALLENEKAYKQAHENKEIKQAAGVIACLAQALAEHPDAKSVKYSAPHTRDAARKLAGTKDYQSARTAFVALKEITSGTAAGEAVLMHPWNKLIGMHQMMEEMNARSSSLRRELRRLRKPEIAAKHASVMAVLSVAMLTDTHEVKKPADIPMWEQLSKDFQKNVTAAAAAARAGNKSEAKEFMNMANNACDKCHEKWRD